MSNPRAAAALFVVFSLSALVFLRHRASTGEIAREVRRPAQAAVSPGAGTDPVRAPEAGLGIAATPAQTTAFDGWLRAWQAAPAAERGPLEAAGVAAAIERRSVMRHLIATDPREALARALPRDLRAQLPAAIRAHVEVPIDARGDFEVLDACACPAGAHAGHPASAEVFRAVTVDGVRYRASVYGRREAQATKHAIPLHGIALDGMLALDERPYRLLGVSEKRARGFAADRPAVMVGFEVQALADAADLARLETSLLAAEAIAGPNPAPARAADAATAWTTGAKQVLVIRVDFSDLPGDPRSVLDGDSPVAITASVAQDWMDRRIAPIFRDMSYGATSLVSTVSPKVYRLPQTAARYASALDFSQLHKDARDAAAADYAVGTFDRVVVVFSSLSGLPGSRYFFAGIASRGGAEVWINGALWSVGHELGHTYGLAHSNRWTVTDGDPLSARGTSTEYGDPFDIMGGAQNYDARAHFNPWWKNKLGWLPDSQVQTVTASGTYRVYRFDHPAATGILALKVARDATRNYWIGLRRNFTDNASLSQGAYVLWGDPNPLASNFLDLSTPGVDSTDGALAIGSSFSDPVGNITIRPIAVGGSGPAEYLDVQVTLGPSAPGFLVVPEAVLASEGQIAGFRVLPSGIPTPTYRWQRRGPGETAWSDLSDNARYAGTTGPTLTVASAGAMSGEQFQCVLTNSSGTAAHAAPATLTVASSGFVTLAGRAGIGAQLDGPGNLARLASPSGVAVGPDGTVYVSEFSGGLRLISRQGVVSTLVRSFPSNPGGVAVDALGFAYVVSSNGHVVYKVSPLGDVSILAGRANTPGNVDAAGGEARFNGPAAIAIDAVGNLYVADANNRTIRRITPAGVVTTFAGQAGGSGSSVDGVGTAARFFLPAKLSIDPRGVLLVSDGGALRTVAPDGTVRTIPRRDNGPLARAAAADFLGNIYFVSTSASSFHRLKPDGTLVALASRRGSTDGAPDVAAVFGIEGVSIDGSGGVLAVEYANHTLRKYIPAGLPGILSQPAAQTVPEGRPATLAVATQGSAAVSYQWFRNGVAITGATNASFTIPAAQAGDSGAYTVAVGNDAGSLQSNPATVNVVTSRLSNVSLRTTLAAEQVLTVGFTMQGGAKPVLIRAAGPGLRALGVTDAMADPRLALYGAAAGEIARNDNWGGDAAVSTTMAAVGAFPFPSAASLDAALVRSLQGGHSVQVSGPAAGNLIVEIYDAGSGIVPRLINLSALNFVGRDGDILIAGFTLLGSGTKNLLIRAVGPSLAQFGVGGVLADPVLTVYDSAQRVVGTNDNFAGSLAGTFAGTGAFPLLPGGRDSAVVLALAAGGYTVQVSGVGNTTGNAMIEIYEVP